MSGGDRIFRRGLRWAAAGPLRFIAVAGLGAYGLSLGLLLSFFLALRGHLHGWIGIGISFALGELAGLLAGIGLWLFVIRKARKLLNG